MSDIAGTAGDPRVIVGAQALPTWNRWDDRVLKIVVGPAPSGDQALRVEAGSLGVPLAERFPRLTHLHLWRIDGLQELPVLPTTLKCLDVRGCRELKALPPLPAGLRVLDIGDCPALTTLPNHPPDALRRFFFNGCTGLKAHRLNGFLDELRERDRDRVQAVATLAPAESPDLEPPFMLEIDGSGAPGVHSLDVFPRARLRRLVLRNCPKLACVDGLDEFGELEHLDLTGAVELRSLPSLPPRIRYFALHGADQLALFRGQGISSIDRGAQGENVARRFRSRLKFGGRLALMPHAKLLLLGDGRVGKTTLAKRLQWEDLKRRGEPGPEHDSLNPLVEPPSTHGIQFWSWPTQVDVGSQAYDRIRASAEAAGVAVPDHQEGLLSASVKIWDFAGQEIYHRTHRLFAGEGTVFLIVWRREPPPRGTPQGGMSVEEWEEFNRHRPVDYWLDYVDQVRSGARMELVCTAHGAGDPPDWRQLPSGKSSRHASRDEVKGFALDTLDPEFEKPDGQRPSLHSYEGLERWIRKACGQEAERIGILQPEFYSRVSASLDRWRQLNREARVRHRKQPYLLLSWARWVDEAQSRHHELAAELASQGLSLPALDSEDIETLTRYLHDSGQLFEIRSPAHRAVVVDQVWAAGILYDLLHTPSGLRERILEHGGWFHHEELSAQAVWKAIPDDAQRQQLLAYMEECQLVVSLSRDRSIEDGRGVYLALDKWLLPKRDELSETIREKLAWQRRQRGAIEGTKFDFEAKLVSEFEFERLQAQLAKAFGASAIYFRHGLLAFEAGNEPQWCVLVEWTPGRDDEFLGHLGATVVAHRARIEAVSRDLEGLVAGESAPDRARVSGIQGTSRRVASMELEWEQFGGGGGRGDIGLSSAGGDSDDARAIKEALQAAGYEVNWYKRPESRADKRGVMEFMETLRHQPVLMLLISESYLQLDAEDNRYCWYELAGAIAEIAAGRRSPQRTLVVFKEGGGFKFSQFDTRVGAGLKTLHAHFLDQRKNRDGSPYTRDFCDAFEGALGETARRAFLRACGTGGAALALETARANDWAELKNFCHRVLGPGRREPLPGGPTAGRHRSQKS